MGHDDRIDLLVGDGLPIAADIEPALVDFAGDLVRLHAITGRGEEVNDGFGEGHGLCCFTKIVRKMDCCCPRRRCRRLHDSIQRLFYMKVLRRFKMFSIFVKTNCVMEILEGLFHLSKHYEDAGEVWMVEGLDFSKPDIHDIVHIADCFARFGCSVIIPRPVHYKSEQYSLLFGNLIGTKFERKCPDLIVDGRFYEYESYVRPWNKRKLANMLSDGLKQSDRIILDNRSGTSLRQILRAINARLNVNAQIAEVWVYDGDSILDIYP